MKRELTHYSTTTTSRRMHVPAHANLAHICTLAQAHTHAHTYMHTYIYTYAYTHIYICTYTYIYTHTYVHICIHTHTQPWVPPWLDVELEKEWLTDITHRAPVSPEVLPSCCLFTFVNARQSLNCAAFTPDVTKLAVSRWHARLCLLSLVFWLHLYDKVVYTRVWQ